MYEFFKNLDKRWIFLLMFLSVVIPIYIIGITGKTFPEVPSLLSKATFNVIEQLNEGDPVLLAFDFDPASEGELGPMATAFTYHCASKGLKLYFISLWPVGPQMIDDVIAKVINPDFPHMKYGVDYMNLGYKPGNEGVIKVIVTDLRELYTTDDKGSGINTIPMMAGIHSVQDFELVINVSAGYAGTKEWIQYAATPYPDKIKIVAGCTGVQAPLLYPYIPQQLPGLLGAIKGAAEYEKIVVDTYGAEIPDPKYLEASRRMGPQLVAHILIILLIIIANWVFFTERKREREVQA
ncbi:MAG: hypothetical protein IIA61_04085 [Candidatus Marinimicrobia bacterium]|nr:hypothetical protein [Candidatus Neomarinimicrobiota bacterium]